MRIWIIIYTHRHGNDVWPVCQKESPDWNEEVAKLDDWEPEREEWLEIFGPFEITGQETANEN